MCLGVPGKIVRWVERDSLTAAAEIEFDGVRRVCHMACVIDADEGDYVIVHAGVAICRLNEVEAERIFAELAKLNDDDGWHGQSEADDSSSRKDSPS